MPEQYPRSPKATVGGIAHLPRLIDKIRMRHAGLIQDYNYLTVGFDKYLLAFLKLEGAACEAFVARVLEGGSDDEILAWVYARSRKPTGEEAAQWTSGLLQATPKDDRGRKIFAGYLEDAGRKRGVPVESLPPVATWVDAIELDEGRL